ncbi:WD domain, G-beta repeat protein [Opisthorchis viverrini]|uniref:WD domain, G-beta repeat protein n=1 Tax=Opisthorchis viverrini TaxID=6198 RepID=A0A1S8X6C0_OPIVI|nr:WD domain, G-beta repeat protein [Opisthorchis viverrini]
MGSDDLTRVRSYFLRNSRVKEFSGYGGKIHTLAWNVSGSRLASGSSDKLVNLYAIDSSKLVKVHTFRGHNESVDQLCWHPSDPELLATVGADGAVRLWDCRSKKDPITAQLKGENINLAWSSDARCIAVGNKTDLISWLDVRAGLKPIQSEQFNFEINEFAWKPNTDIFLLTTGLGSILVYSGKPGDMRRETSLQAHPVNAMCLQFTNSGRYFAVGSADALVSIWDADEFVCIRTLSRTFGPVVTLKYPDYSLPVGWNGPFELWVSLTTQSCSQLPVRITSLTLVTWKQVRCSNVSLLLLFVSHLYLAEVTTRDIVSLVCRAR